MDLRSKHLLALALLMTAVIELPAQERHKIAPNTPLTELLPVPPSVTDKTSVLIDDDLTQVAEVMFGELISSKVTRQKAQEQIELAMAKINHLNKKNPDGFMEALRAKRDDLKGLPFRMGGDCRTDAERARLFRTIATDLRSALAAAPGRLASLWWEPTLTTRRAQVAKREKGSNKSGTGMDDYDRMLVGAAMQIMAAEPPPVRVGDRKSV